MADTITAELDGIDLGDPRLDRRSLRLIEALFADSQASINAAAGGWAETIAAYRFFDNRRVTPDAILAPHREATLTRIQQHSWVVIAQDTTELDFTQHPPKDARCLNQENRFGFYQHTQLALTLGGLPLGVVRSSHFDRAAESLGKSAERTRLPIEEKESFRWLEGYRLASELARRCPNTRVVSVADREADIYDLFTEARDQPEGGADFVIRAKEQRRTTERNPAAVGADYPSVRDKVAASAVRLRRSVELAATPKRKARQAELEIRAMTLEVQPPHGRGSLGPVVLNVVLIEEVGGPDDGTAVSWLLLTNLPIDTIEAIEKVVDSYVARWGIEVYFRILKSGCRVEEMRLETTARCKNCLAFYAIIAWRVMYATYLNRECPELPCDTVFGESEWKSVWQVTKKMPAPEVPPMLSEFMVLLAGLGGYNNRVSDGPPGPQAIWVGIRRMTDFAIAWDSFGPGQGTCV